MSEEYKAHLDSIQKNIEKADTDIRASKALNHQIRQDSEKRSDHLDKLGEHIEKISRVINALPSEQYESVNENQIGHLSRFDAITDQWAIGASRQRAELEAGTNNLMLATSAGTVTYGTTSSASMAVISLGNVFAEGNEQVKIALNQYKEPGQIERRQLLADRLHQISPTLKTKWNEAFSSFADGRNMSAAHAMREVLSGLGHELGPNSQVIKANWYQPVGGRNEPTQAQRLKYAIIGNSKPASISDADLASVNTLAMEARKSYDKLNAEAHRRTEKWDADVVREYLGSGENIVYDVLYLREQLNERDDSA